MSTTEEMLKNDIELAKGIGTLAESVNQTISILAKAILELDDPEEARPTLTVGTRQALWALAETEV